MKHIIIHNCSQCPYMRAGKRDWRCELNPINGTHLYKIIPEHYQIPNYCTLDNYTKGEIV